jgi:hypothetical protein
MTQIERGLELNPLDADALSITEQTSGESAPIVDTNGCPSYLSHID